MLRQSGVSQNDIGLIRTLLQYGGEKKRSGDVLNNKSFFSSLKTSFKKVSLIGPASSLRLIQTW